MRQTALNTVFEIAKVDPRVLFIGSDLGVGTLQAMKRELPDQFMMEGISEQHIMGGDKTDELEIIKIYANSHYITPRPTVQQAIKEIKSELATTLEKFKKENKLLEAQRLEERTRFDLEMIDATGTCSGIENYSRFLSGRKQGEPPPTLFEYLPDKFINIY